MVVRRRGVRRSQRWVAESFRMLGADGWQPPHAHAVVRVHGRSEIVAAVYGDFVAQAGQFVASLLVIGFDAAVLGDQAATSDERDADAAAREIGRASWRERV